MAGTSIASVLGSGITVSILLLHFRSKSNGLYFSLQGFSFSYIKNIFTNGFTSFLVEITSGIVMFIFNIEFVTLFIAIYFLRKTSKEVHA